MTHVLVKKILYVRNFSEKRKPQQNNEGKKLEIAQMQDKMSSKIYKDYLNK